jgi:hypothetical protein
MEQKRTAKGRRRSDKRKGKTKKTQDTNGAQEVEKNGNIAKKSGLWAERRPTTEKKLSRDGNKEA